MFNDFYLWFHFWRQKLFREVVKIKTPCFHRSLIGYIFFKGRNFIIIEHFYTATTFTCNHHVVLDTFLNTNNSKNKDLKELDPRRSDEEDVDERLLLIIIVRQ